MSDDALAAAVAEALADHWFPDGGNTCECGYWAEFDSVKRHHIEDAVAQVAREHTADAVAAALAPVERLADEWATDSAGGDLRRSLAVDDLRIALAEGKGGERRG